MRSIWGSFKQGETFLAIGILLIVVMMLLPVPLILLDFLLVLNILVSITLLLFTIYTDRPLSLSSFPTFLLVVTLFRLALNVSTTRQLLLSGEAGEVIRRFGEFAIGGNTAVGLIIFLILVIVNFLVITKGSERVSEVAARFTLDAMPGKQMAIDADLNAGLITDAEARRRRQEVAREADFYGAMDGASKFVKGDAIAGLVIVAVNIIGGLIVGVLQQNMAFAEAWQHYSLRTVGDGLVSQIPALLVSTATGILVTRAASVEGLGADVMQQVGANPFVFLLGGGALALIGLMPGLPFLPFFAVGGAVAGLGVYRLRRREETQPTTAEEEPPLPEAAEDPVQSMARVDPIEIELGFGLVPLTDPKEGGLLVDKVSAVRRQIAGTLGLVLPYVRIRDNLGIAPYEYHIKLRGNTVGRFEILADHLLAIDPGDLDETLPGVPTTEPAFGLPAVWITPGQRQQAELLGYTVVDATAVITTHLTEVLTQHGWELLGRQDVKRLVDAVKEEHPALIEELTPKLLSLGEIQKVLQNLLRENVPIRDLVLIFETLADHALDIKDPGQLTEKVRVALGRTIVTHLGLSDTIPALTLSADLEQRLIHIQRNEAPAEKGFVERLVNALVEQTHAVTRKGYTPILITAPTIRPLLRRLAENACPRLTVLSWAELDPKMQVQSVGVIQG